MPLVELLPCPFCGGYAEFERMGGPRNSCVVACQECGCRLESNEGYPNSGKQWNARITSQDWLERFVKCYDIVRAGWNYTELHHLLDKARTTLRTP